jgi:hypothetical protein
MTLPKAERFPAKPRDFLRQIVNAKDSMARLRRFLRERGPRSSFWIGESPHRPPGFKAIETLVPRSAFGNVEKPLSEVERDVWADSQIKAITDGDNTGGYWAHLDTAPGIWEWE